MWWLIGLLALALAPCAPRPTTENNVAATPEGVRFLDQGWTAADRNVFTTTAQGSYLMPLPWVGALRRVDVDAPFFADQSRVTGIFRGQGRCRSASLPTARRRTRSSA